MRLTGLSTMLIDRCNKWGKERERRNALWIRLKAAHPKNIIDAGHFDIFNIEAFEIFILKWEKLNILIWHYQCADTAGASMFWLKPHSLHCEKDNTKWYKSQFKVFIFSNKMWLKGHNFRYCSWQDNFGCWSQESLFEGSQGRCQWWLTRSELKSFLWRDGTNRPLARVGQIWKSGRFEGPIDFSCWHFPNFDPTYFSKHFFFFKFFCLFPGWEDSWVWEGRHSEDIWDGISFSNGILDDIW